MIKVKAISFNLHSNQKETPTYAFSCGFCERKD